MNPPLKERILSGDTRGVARGISIAERGGPEAYRLLHELYGEGNSYILGITGPPGSGKSSLIDSLIGHFKPHFDKIGVLAVDPSSPFTGGAILGDRIRMQRHSGDPKLFIRSMASRGHLGGISAATRDATTVLKAAGFDLIIVETLGIGQAEVEIVSVTDTTVLVQVPGLGDDIQVMKSGIMEIGDIFAVNKSDREGAEKLARYLQSIIVENYDSDRHVPPVILTSVKEKSGLDNLTGEILSHRDYLRENGLIREKEALRIRRDIEALLELKVAQLLKREFSFEENIDAWAELVLSGGETPFSLVDSIESRLGANSFRYIETKEIS